MTVKKLEIVFIFCCNRIPCDSLWNYLILLWYWRWIVFGCKGASMGKLLWKIVGHQYVEICREIQRCVWIYLDTCGYQEKLGFEVGGLGKVVFRLDCGICQNADLQNGGGWPHQGARKLGSSSHGNGRHGATCGSIKWWGVTPWRYRKTAHFCEIQRRAHEKGTVRIR